MKSTILALLVLAALAGSASAHMEAFTQAKPLNIGPYNAIVQPRPEPMFANTALSMTAIFSKAATGQFAGNLDSTLVLVSPSGANKSVKLQPDGTGYMIGSIVVQEAGNYTFDIIVRDQNGTYRNGTTFTVYPDLPVRFRSEDPQQSDPIAGEPYTIGIHTIDPTTLTPKDAFTDLTLHLEHWKLDHSEKYGVVELPMQRASLGTWRSEHVFPVVGMYHLRFSSVAGGFMPDDAPILHVNALEPLPPTNDTPAVPAGAILALALAAFVLHRRR